MSITKFDYRRYQNDLSYQESIINLVKADWVVIGARDELITPIVDIRSEKDHIIVTVRHGDGRFENFTAKKIPGIHLV